MVIPGEIEIANGGLFVCTPPSKLVEELWISERPVEPTV